MARRNLVRDLEHKQWLLLIVLVAGLYVVLPQLGAFHSSWQILGQADLTSIWLAIVFSGATYLAAAGSYYVLAWHRLPYWRTAVVQLASMFANRLLPAGIGGLGVNYVYLRKSHHTTAQAGSVVAANNLLGFVGHLLLVSTLLAAGFGHGLGLRPFVHLHASLAVKLFVVLLAIMVVLVSLRHQRSQRGIHRFFKQLLAYRHRPSSLAGALAASLSLTLCNVLSFYFCAQALGVHISLLTALLVFTLGVVLGTITPTPGGLGGVEAGLTIGLIAFRVSDGDALAVSLAYRLVSYWLALLVGALAFIFAERRRFLTE